MLARTRILMAAIGLAIAAPAVPGFTGVAEAGAFERQVREAVGKIPRHKLRKINPRKIREAEREARRVLRGIKRSPPRNRGSWKKRRR